MTIFSVNLFNSNVNIRFKRKEVVCTEERSSSNVFISIQRAFGQLSSIKLIRTQVIQPFSVLVVIRENSFSVRIDTKFDITTTICSVHPHQSIFDAYRLTVTSSCLQLSCHDFISIDEVGIQHSVLEHSYGCSSFRSAYLHLISIQFNHVARNLYTRCLQARLIYKVALALCVLGDDCAHLDFRSRDGHTPRCYANLVGILRELEVDLLRKSILESEMTPHPLLLR